MPETKFHIYGEDAVSMAESAVMVDTLGQDAMVKTLFKDPVMKNWRLMQPGDEIFKAGQDEKYALVVRREATEDQVKIKLTSILVQSPHLKELLGKIFEGFMGISTELREVEFKSPFHEFCYKWADLQRAIGELRDETAIQHAKLLQPIIAEEIAPKLDRMNDLMDHGLVSFDYLWSIFEPGQDLYTRLDGHDRLFRIISGEVCKQDYEIKCEYIDTDGKAFGFAEQKFKIHHFKGLKKINSLTFVPAKYCPSIEEIKARMKTRGARFRDMVGVHHVTYAGTYLPETTKKPQSVSEDQPAVRHTPIHLRPKAKPLKRGQMSNGRVIIDCESCVANADGIKQPKLNLELEKRQTQVPPTTPEQIDLEKYDATTGDEASNAQSKLPDHLLAYCSSTVRGYCLTTRQWAIFDIDSTKPVQWSSDAFQRLILSPDWKEVLFSFVASQMSQSSSDTDEAFDDIIKGKGKGMVMLLSGAPGIGKTLTAESVAEEMRLPLYSMSMGQLGSTALKVEKNLKLHMELSTRWKAVMLLDECDVFLAKRTVEDLERNKLVSVFLRTLEYFQGTMFLTTNRIETFDPAFESRIHLTFNYPALDRDARRRVWKNFVGSTAVMAEADAAQGTEGQSSASGVSETDLDALATLEINGRVIKNVVKTARLLAVRKERPLTLQDLETVLRVKGMEIKPST